MINQCTGFDVISVLCYSTCKANFYSTFVCCCLERSDESVIMKVRQFLQMSFVMGCCYVTYGEVGVGEQNVRYDSRPSKPYYSTLNKQYGGSDVQWYLAEA